MSNIFREAKGLMEQKDAGQPLTDDQMKLIAMAIIPLDFLMDHLTLAEGLGELAELAEQ